MSNNPALPTSAVYTLDAAIDQVRSNVEKYAETRDVSHLAFLPGSRPTVYSLRPIGTQMMTQWVDATPSVPEKWKRAFQVAVERIENLPHETGTMVDPVTLPGFAMRNPAGGELFVWNEEATDMIKRRVDGAAIYEIGCMAYEAALLGKTLARGAVSWSLPPHSRAALDRMNARRVEQSRNAAPTTSDAASARSTAPRSAPSSADPGDATAAPSDGVSTPPA
jgi:hypothetical protein